MKTPKNLKSILAAAIIGVLIVIVALILRSPSAVTDAEHLHENHNHQEKGEQAGEWTCSMHPQVRRDEPGLCPICAMDLIPVDKGNGNDESVHPDAITLSESAARLADIQTAVVTRGFPEKTLNLTGKVVPDERTVHRISARFPGRFETLRINVTGQNVKKGDVLGTIYSSELISAHKELLEAAKVKNTNPSFYRAARQKLSLWNISDEHIDKLEKQTVPETNFEIRADRQGIVTHKYISEGDYVKEGSPLYDVVDLSRVWVLFDVYEKDLARLRTGEHVSFTAAGIPDKEFSGKITFIDPVVDPHTRVVKARAEIANPELALKPDQFVRGMIHTMGKEGLLVPRSALLWTGKRSVVYVKQTDVSHPAFVMREVTAGEAGDNVTVVLDGLNEGDIVVANGVFKVDASAQLAGKPGMMNPEGGGAVSGHDHGQMSGNRKQSEKKSSHEMTHSSSMVQESFRVSGLCGMCKNRIEKTAKGLSGVMSADWDAESQMLKISYHPDKISLREIHKAIAAVGHDTDLEKAPDDVYEKLPGCCLYRQ